MFEYVAGGIVTDSIVKAAKVATDRTEYAGLVVKSVKRVTEKRIGGRSTFTVVLMVESK